jgi:hypothetical protein
LRELAALRAQQGSMDAAIEALRDVLRIEPADEAAHRELMLAYQRTGARDEALRQFERMREVLRREIGVAPSEQSEQVLREIATEAGRNSGAATANGYAALSAAGAARSRLGAQPGGRWRAPLLTGVAIAMVIGGLAIALALVLLADSGASPSSAASIEQFELVASQAIREIRGDCVREDLLISGTLEGDASGDIVGKQRGSFEAAVSPIDECRSLVSRGDFVLTTANDDEVRYSAVAISARRIEPGDPLERTNSTTSVRSADVILGGTGRYAGMVGRGGCRAVGARTGETGASEAHCTWKLAALQASAPVLVQIAANAEEFAWCEPMCGTRRVEIAGVYANVSDAAVSGARLRLDASPAGNARIEPVMAAQLEPASSGEWLLPLLRPGQSGYFRFYVRLETLAADALIVTARVALDGAGDSQSDPLVLRVLR